MKNLKKFDLNNINKSNWKSFPFEKIAFRIAETVDPNTTELNIYYGLEHLDAESLHIRRNGVPGDVSGGKLKCYPGDIIFGKRRAYQRKAGIVKEAGICSAHSFVFRANEEIIDARLFPFFLHSDQFMHKMIDISVGGLSPTINWSDLKHQEFLLPPKEQQAALADLLWAMDDVIEKEEMVINILETNYSSSIRSIFKNSKTSIKLKEIKFQSFKGLSGDEVERGNFYLIPSGAVFPRFLKVDKFKKVNIYNEKKYLKALEKGDILFNTGGVGTLGRSHYFNMNGINYICDSFVLVMRFNDEKFINKFIYHTFQSNSILSQIIQHTKGTTGITSIGLEGIENFKIPNIKIEEQKSIVEKLDLIEELIFMQNNRKEKSKFFLKSLINLVF